MSDDDLKKLASLHNLICQVGARLANGSAIDYLEIGVQEGIGLFDIMSESFVRFAVGIDTWGGTYGGTNRGSPDHVTARLEGKMKDVLLLTGNSPEVLRGMRHPFDLILVDGDHSAQGCLADLNNCRHLLKPTGSILVDDLNHTAHPYLHAIAKQWAGANKMTFTFHDAAWGVGELRYP